MQKKGAGRIFSSRGGKISVVLLLMALMIFVFAFLIFEGNFVEAGFANWSTIRTPSNFTFNATGNSSSYPTASRNINFTFNVTWQQDRQNASGNCSLWVNSTTTVSPFSNGWQAVKNISNLTRYATPAADDQINNYTGAAATLSYINFTFPADGNYTVAVACVDHNGTGAGYNFSANYTFVLDTTPPRLFAITPNATLKDAKLWVGQASGNFSGWPILFLLNISDNNTHTAWYTLNASITTSASWTAGTSIGQLENKSGTMNNNTMARSIVGNANIMDQYNGSVYLNITSNWRGPGPHSVVFCANDSAGNKICTGSYDFVITGTNVTQMRQAFASTSFGSTGGAHVNITYGNGTGIPEGDTDSGGAPPSDSFFNPLTNNYTFVFNVTSTNSRVYLVGLKIDETKLGNVSGSNLTTSPEKEILSSVGYGFNTTYTGGDFSNFMPDFIRFQFGVIEQPGVGFNRHMYCSGATIASPNCTAIVSCNSTAFSVYNSSAVLAAIISPTSGGPSACYVEGDKGQLNGVALTVGRTYTFVTHFSGGALGNDTGAPEIQFFGNLVNGAKDKTRHETPPYDVSIYNTTGTSILINFTVADINSTGVNMSINTTINVTVANNGDGLSSPATRFWVGGVNSNLTCVPNGFATNSSVYNITGADHQGNLTDGVNCTLTVTGLTNGTKNITVMAKDASNNSNINLTSLLVTIDQIPPVVGYFNITELRPGSTLPGGGDNNRTLNASDFAGSAQGRNIFLTSNWSDNLTQTSVGRFQFYNTSSGWQTLNTSASNITLYAYMVNFSYPIPTGHNEFEGKNISFRVIANDTLGNVNSTNDVKNITVNINDTTKPTITINGTAAVNGSNLSSTAFTASWSVVEGSSLRSINISIDGTDQTAENLNLCVKFKQFANTDGGSADPNTNRNASFSILTTGTCPLTNGSHSVTIVAADIYNNTEKVFNNFSVGSAGVPALNFSNVSNGNIQIKTAVNNSNLTSSTARANVIGLGFYGLGVAPLSVANLSYVSSCNSTSTVYFSNNTVVYPFNESTCPEFSANRSLVVTVTDTAGNSNSTTFGFLVDNVEPSLAVWSPTDGQYFTNVNVSINFSVRDKDNSISSVGYYLDNSPFVTAIINSSAMGGSAGQGVNESDSRLLNFTPGTHTIKLTANDSLGNVINGSDLIFTITGPFNFTGYINDSLRVINNISIVNLTNSTGHTINFDAGSLKNTEDETWNLIMKLNSSAGTANVTIVFNASAANWDKNFSIAINDSKLKRDINNNYTASIQELISFNSSIQSFLSNNNSYYGVVTYKINASNATYSAPIGGSLEIWYFPDLGDLTSKTNITECSAGFSPSLSTALSAGTFPCWNNTNNISINIYVPHFSGIAIVNDSNAPAVNVSMPSDANQSTSMFVPNITVSSDTDSCLSSVNGTVANVTMTKSGTTCMGQTERFTNLNAPNGGYNFTFSVTDGNGNVNQYVWKFNVTDATTPNNGIITSSPSTISSTVTITGTNESVNATVNYGTVNTTLGSSAVQTDFNETQIVTISGLSESTTYHYNVTVCDFAGNCKTNSTVFSFATSAAAAAAASTTTSSSSGGGGGGAAAPTTEVASASRSWDSLAADSTGTFKISSSSIAFTNIVIAVVSTVSNPTVGVSSLTSNPQSSAPSSIVYQYLKITHSNIADSDISSATISFKVPKSWLTTNNVAEGDIVLYRFNSGQWNALPTTITGSDADNVWFEAVTPGFSDYAIGSKAGAPTTPVTTEQPAPSTQPVAPATPAATGQPSQSTQPDGTKPVRNNNLAWIVVAIIVIVAALCFVIWQKKKSQQ